MRNLVILTLGVLFVIAFTATPVFAQFGPEEGKCPNKPKDWKDGKWCKKCDKILEEADIDKDGNCAKHKEKPLDVKVCERKGWQCPECKEFFPKKGKCKECKKELVEVVDKARVVYPCKECDEDHDTPKCPKTGKELKGKCSKAGEYPHKAEVKKPQWPPKKGPMPPKKQPKKPKKGEEEE